MTCIRMIRHSLTEGNERRLYYGKTDLPLSERGLMMCKGKRGSFPQRPETLLVHTGMLRTLQTLGAVMEPGETMVCPGLREMDMGRFEMHGYEELRYDPDYIRWITEQEDDRPLPGGESNAQVRARIHAALREIVSLRRDDVFIVAHGGPIAHAMQFFFPEDGRSFYDWIPRPVAGYAVTLDGDAAHCFTKI